MISLLHPALRNSPTISQRTKATQISKPVVLSRRAVASQAAIHGSIWAKWPYVLGSIAVVASIAIGVAAYSSKYITSPPLPPSASQPFLLPVSIVSIIPVAASAAIFRLGAGSSKVVYRADLVPKKFMIMFPSGKVVCRKETPPIQEGSLDAIITS